MTTLSSDQELIIRTWVGDDPTSSELEELYDALGSWDEVVTATLRKQVADLTSQPSSFSVPGLSISIGQQLQAAQLNYKAWLNGNGTGLDGEATMGLLVGQIVRPTSTR